GNFDDALRAIAAGRTPAERADLLISMTYQIQSVQKRKVVLNFLEQATPLVGSSIPGASQQELHAVLQVAAVSARLGSNRAFEMVEPLLARFNDLSAAAKILDGFVQPYYRDGELQLQNGNPVGSIANQIAQTFGPLSFVDFDRARQD